MHSLRSREGGPVSAWRLVNKIEKAGVRINRANCNCRTEKSEHLNRLEGKEHESRRWGLKSVKRP